MIIWVDSTLRGDTVRIIAGILWRFGACLSCLKPSIRGVRESGIQNLGFLSERTTISQV